MSASLPRATGAFDALNAVFGEMYEEHVAATVAAIPDVIVARSTPEGGRYSRYRHGALVERVAPVPEEFRVLKSIGHGPTALAALPPGDAEAPARLAASARAALASLPAWELEPDVDAAARLALEATAELAAAPPDTLPADVTEACERLIREAGRYQAIACRSLLGRWRREIGDGWGRVHAIVGTGWGVREHGTHYEVLVHEVGRDALGTRLFASMGEKEEDRLLRRLGVILANRGTCRRVLGDPGRMDVELIGDAVESALAEADAREARCPVHGA